MTNDLIFKKGDILIDFGKAYIVSAIKNQPTQDGKIEPYIIYKPYIVESPDRSLICSIAVSSLTDSHIRKPLNKREISKLLKIADTKPIDIDKLILNKSKIDEILQSNDLTKIMKLLIKLWIPKEELTNKSNKTNIRICNEAITMLSREIAIVYGISVDKAKQVLLSKLI